MSAPEYRIDWLLTGEPRPAQIEALQRSYHGYKWRDSKYEEAASPTPLVDPGLPRVGWAHFMEMRVGKTPTALNEFMLFKRDYSFGRMLVFSPNKYKNKWGEEAELFGVDVPIHVVQNSDRKALQKFMDQAGNEGVVVVNYEALIQDSNCAVLAEWVNDRTFVVADESVILKNWQSKFFVNGIKLAKQAAAVRPMTGLPTPQGPHDLWAQLRFGRMLNGFEYYPFRGRFVEMGGFKGRQMKDTRNEKELNELLDKISFRGRRADWGTKIESDYEQVSLSMSPRQKEAYDQMEKDFVMWLDDGRDVTAEQVITKRMKMQQISSGFIYDEFKTAHSLMPFNKTPKFEDLWERLTTEISGKVIVIGHHTHTILQLYEALKALNPALIFGDQHMKRLGLESESEKNRFNGDPSCKVMIGQSQAIKYGHTLMGSATHPCLSLCFFENNYNLDNRAQTEERPQGEGQQDAIHIWDYFSSAIEREIVVALQKKKQVADVIMKFYQ